MADEKKEVLFEITKDQLETGLRGVPVGYCPTSTVNPYEGLFYVEKPIHDIAKWDPEQIIYLLYYGEEGNPSQIQKFSDNLKSRATCSPELLKQICQLPRKSHPMNLFCIAILLCGMLEGVGDYREDCLNLIAKAPVIASTVINYHAGWGKTKPSDPNLGYMENFSQMLNIPKGESPELTSIFKLFNILHYDHGGGNLSTFVGKAVASGLEDMYGSITAAMCALAGPKHGRANQDNLEFVEEILKELGENVTEANLEKFLRDRLKNNQLIFGFGHAVLRVEDTRASLFYEVAETKYSHNPLVKIARLLRQVTPKILGENPKITDPYPNVDAISGILLAAAGFPYPEYFTILFGLSRIVGISIQIVYERCEARGGRGTPIVRPKYIYRPRQGDK